MHILLVSNGAWSLPDSVFAGWAGRVSRMEDRPEVTPFHLDSAPDVIFIGLVPEENLLALVEWLKRSYPRAAIIPHVTSPNSDLLLRLMRAGIADVLTQETPTAMRELAERAVGGAAAPESQASAAPSLHRIAFMSAKGGAGSTVLMANLGLALARLGSLRVLLVDLAVPFGDLDIYLTTERPDHDLADLTAEVERLDQPLFKAMVHHINDQVDLIACPQGVERVMQITPASVMRLIATAGAGYDMVLLDFGSSIDPVKLQLLETLDRLAIVAMLDIPNARHTSQMFALLNGLEFPVEKISLIINRSGRGAAITPEEMEGAVGRPVARMVPDAGNLIAESLARGLPAIAAQPSSDFAVDIDEWATELLGLPKKRKSLWQRLRNK